MALPHRYLWRHLLGLLTSPARENLRPNIATNENVADGRIRQPADHMGRYIDMSPRLGRSSPPVRLVLGVVAMLTLAACGNGTAGRAASQPTPSDQPTSSTASQSPSETATVSQSPSETATSPSRTPSASRTPEPRLIRYALGENPGIFVQNRADVSHLHGAPDSFKKFVGNLAENLTAKSTCTSGSVGVTVETLRTDGYAVGAVNDCGGYQALWVQADGHWRRVEGTQDSWNCKVLHKYRVPSAVVGTSCYDYDAKKQHTYQQA